MLPPPPEYPYGGGASAMMNSTPTTLIDARERDALLREDDPPVFLIERAQGTSAFLLTCDRYCTCFQPDLCRGQARDILGQPHTFGAEREQ